MPLKKGKSVGYYMHELKADNKKKGKERGQNGHMRSRKQMVAISLKMAGKSRKK